MQTLHKNCILQKLRKNQIKWLTLIFIVIAITAGMVGAFVHFLNSIHNKTLDKEIQHLEEVSGYLTKIIQLEMDHCVTTLDTSEDTLCVSENPMKDKMQDVLEKIGEKTDFENIGIIGLDGSSADDDGIPGNISDDELMEKIKNDEPYISDMIQSGEREVGQILVAVPLHDKDNIIGAIWGQYPVTAIAKKIELTEKSDIYFQIIDNNGNYISRSGNEHAFAEDMELWDELELYDLSDGVTIEKIKSDVENHRSGNFYFNYRGEGRYVSYEPLGINNWYVFSVLVEDAVNADVNAVLSLSLKLLLSFFAFVIILFSVIGITGYQGVKMIKKQNQRLRVKTKLFGMILRKTKDVPFELDVQTKRLKIYHHGFETESGEEYESIDNFSIEKMLEEGRIRKKDAEKYRQMYKESLKGKEIKPRIFKIKLDKVWEWNKVHLLRIDNQSMIGFLENYDEQIEKNKQIEVMDYKTKHDVLTGVYNREAFIDAVEKCFNDSGKEKKGIFALFLLDLDNFKELNDSLGHVVGDRALEDTALALKSLKRAEDVIGRIGGDEFMLFMKEAEDIDAIRKYAETINQALIKTYTKKGKKVMTSASIGIALVEDEMTFLELYEKADRVLYKVKEERRNGYRIE